MLESLEYVCAHSFSIGSEIRQLCRRDDDKYILVIQDASIISFIPEQLKGPQSIVPASSAYFRVVGAEQEQSL